MQCRAYDLSTTESLSMMRKPELVLIRWKGDKVNLRGSPTSRPTVDLGAFILSEMVGTGG